MPSSKKTILLPKGHGLRQLLADDPTQFLLYAVEQVQEQAHPRRIERVVKAMQRRRYSSGWVHVSDMLQPCDLVIGARLLGYKLPEETPTKRMQRIFDNGSFMHMRFQNYFLSLPSAFKVRVSAVLRRWPIVGEADIIVEHKHFGRIVVELKSMNDRRFSELKGAEGDHRNQVNMYLHLDEADSSQVWYENKNDQEIKAYHYPPETEDFDALLQRAREIFLQIVRGEMPKPCGLCGLDDYIAGLKFTDERVVAMEKERERWLKTNLF